MPRRPFLRLFGLRDLGGIRMPIAERSIMYAPLVGAAAGVGAMLFHVMCLVVTHYGLEAVTGYEQGGPRNETTFADDGPTANSDDDADSLSLTPWLLILVPTVGGLISGVLVFKFAPEAEGHGTDSAIEAYHSKGGEVRPRVTLVKMLASAITIGSGGSGGREGPIAQIGAGFGSLLATKLKLSHSDRRILMAAGLGAGIGAIFHAPLAGAIFAIEVLYSDPDFESEPLIPAFIATTVSYTVFSLLSMLVFAKHAFVPLFAGLQDLTFTSPALLAPLTVLVFAMVPASLLYVRLFYGTQKVFHRAPLPNMFKPAVGAMLTGVVAVVLYYVMTSAGDDAQHDSLSVLSFGYGCLQTILDPAAGLPLLSVLLVVGLGKLLTTSLTIGSGGSGGVFGPSMVIGGALGAAVGLLFHQWTPDLVTRQDVIVFALLGMASFFAATANTPVSTLIMVSELTASYELLLPSMWVCALAYLLSRKWSIYNKQVRSRRDSPAHRGEFIIDVLEHLSVNDALADAHRRFITVPIDMPLSDVSQLITNTTQSSFPCVDAKGHYYGLFSLNDIRQFLYDSQLGALAVAQDLATAGVEPLRLQMRLSDVIGRFARGRFEELPVVSDDDPRTVVAMLRRADVIALYDKRLIELRADVV